MAIHRIDVPPLVEEFQKTAQKNGLYDDRMPEIRRRFPHQSADWFGMTVLFGACAHLYKFQFCDQLIKDNLKTEFPRAGAGPGVTITWRWSVWAVQAAVAEAAEACADPAAVECAIPAGIPAAGAGAAFPAEVGDTVRQAALGAGLPGAILPAFPEMAFRTAGEARSPLGHAPCVP